MKFRQSHSKRIIVLSFGVILLGAAVFLGLILINSAGNSISHSKETVSLTIKELNSRETLKLDDLKILESSIALELEELCRNLSVLKNTECDESRVMLSSILTDVSELVKIIEYQEQISNLLPSDSVNASVGDSSNSWGIALESVQALSVDDSLRSVQTKVISAITQYSAGWKVLSSADIHRNFSHFNNAKIAIQADYSVLKDINTEIDNKVIEANKSLGESVTSFISS